MQIVYNLAMQTNFDVCSMLNDHIAAEVNGRVRTHIIKYVYNQHDWFVIN